MTTLEYVLTGLVVLSSGLALWRGMQWAQQVGTLTHERNNALDRVEALAARLRDVEPREARFRQSLGYYADDETWVALGRAHSPAFHDRGKVAKLALNYDARYKAFADALESARTAADVSVAVAMSREALAGAQ